MRKDEDVVDVHRQDSIGEWWCVEGDEEGDVGPPSDGYECRVREWEDGGTYCPGTKEKDPLESEIP